MTDYKIRANNQPQFRLKVIQEGQGFLPQSPVTIKNQVGNLIGKLSDIPDVDVVSLANGAVIVYNSSTNSYEIKPMPVGNGIISNTVLYINAGSSLTLNSSGLFVNNNLVLNSLAISGNLSAGIIQTTANNGLVAQSNGSAIVFGPIDEGLF